MTDMELADAIERMRREAGGRNQFALWLLTNVDEIIAALRRGSERQPSGVVMVPREPYWLIERGSPAEWWVRGMPEVWTTDASKAQRFNEWGAKTHAKELESWGVKGPLWATEQLDCDGPLSAAEAEGRKA